MSVSLILKVNREESRLICVFRYTAVGYVAAENTVLPLVLTAAVSKGWFPEAVTAAVDRARYSLLSSA